MKVLLGVFGALAATFDVAKRRLACLRRGYHRTLDPGGVTCLDCWTFLEP